MTRQEIDAATKIVMSESNMDESRARNLAKRILEAAEHERLKFMEGLFGPEIIA